MVFLGEERRKNVATKLKHLKIKKVDFVDEGANPEAHIKLFKNKDGVEPGEIQPKNSNIWKRLFSFLGKTAGIGEEEIETAIEEIEKGNSEGFTDKLHEMKTRKIADEIWDVCYALQHSLCSILNDGELDSVAMANTMQESLDEFYSTVQECISQWSGGKETGIVKKKEEVTETDLKMMKSVVERFHDSVQEEAAAGQLYRNRKGEEEMKIDKSKLTTAERAFLENMEKRYGKEEPNHSETTEVNQQTQEGSVAKSVVPSKPSSAGSVVQEAEGFAAEDIYKGLHPAVKAELEELKKFREATEERELTEVAKRYAIIGKKEEELVPLFKSLKAAGGTAYQDMIAILDQAVDTVEKSGVFSEIGKAGYGSYKGSAWAEAEGKAVELMKSKTGLTKAQALDEVLLENPELAARCEKEE